MVDRDVEFTTDGYSIYGEGLVIYNEVFSDDQLCKRAVGVGFFRPSRADVTSVVLARCSPRASRCNRLSVSLSVLVSTSVCLHSHSSLLGASSLARGSVFFQKSLS
jgi:hypothetical protein